jgi:hypothetical protein
MVTLKRIANFILEGCKAQITLLFRDRELAHRKIEYATATALSFKHDRAYRARVTSPHGRLLKTDGAFAQEVYAVYGVRDAPA